MKNIKFLLFIICLVFFLNVIFFNCSFATLYILKNQEGKDIWITNQENIVSKYEKLGYVIWVLGARGLSQKSIEPESIPNKVQPQLEPESINFKTQTKVVLPPTTKLIPTPKTKLIPTPNSNRDKIIEIFKKEASLKWGNNYEMVNYTVRNQTQAYDWVVNQTKYPDIMAMAKNKWQNNYEMIKYTYENQVEAYKWGLSQSAYPDILAKAKQKWGGNHEMVKYEYDQQVSAYKWLENNKAKNPEAFKRASNKWGNNYVMVKYEYEKGN